MRVNCIGCGHMMDLGRDYDNFKGQVRCNVCRALHIIESENGSLKSIMPASAGEMSKKEKQ